MSSHRFPICLNTFACKAHSLDYFQKWEHLNLGDLIDLHPDGTIHLRRVYMSTYISGIEEVDFISSKIDMDSGERNSNRGEEELEFELEEHEQDAADDDDEKDEILKRRISSHPLYQLLVEAHLECLKVGDISNLDTEQKILQKQAMKKQDLGMFSQSELDLFMEAYCLALGKLKEAMEDPQLKSMAFINSMHSQLRELTKTTLHAPAEPAATATASASSSECKFRIDPTI